MRFQFEKGPDTSAKEEEGNSDDVAYNTSIALQIEMEDMLPVRPKTKQLYIDVTGASTLNETPIQLLDGGSKINSVRILEPTL